MVNKMTETKYLQMNQVFTVKYTQEIIKVTKSSQFAWDIPGLSTKNPMSKETPQSRANRDDWLS